MCTIIPVFMTALKTKIDKRQESLDKDWRGSRMQPGGGNDGNLYVCSFETSINTLFSHVVRHLLLILFIPLSFITLILLS